MAADTWKQFERNPISHSAAHHIIAIAELMESSGYARVSDVARSLDITRGSASLTLKSLRQRGLVLEDENRFLRLSDKGDALANAVRGKKYLFDRFFRSILGVSPGTADEDTCKIEHLLSNETADRMTRLLRFMTSDDPTAKAFLQAWSQFGEPCNHEPAECPACNSECMVSICDPRPSEENPAQ